MPECVLSALVSGPHCGQGPSRLVGFVISKPTFLLSHHNGGLNASHALRNISRQSLIPLDLFLSTQIFVTDRICSRLSLLDLTTKSRGDLPSYYGDDDRCCCHSHSLVQSLGLEVTNSQLHLKDDLTAAIATVHSFSPTAPAASFPPSRFQES